MNLSLKQHILVFVFLTILPSLIILPMGVLGYGVNISISTAGLILMVLLSLSAYYFITYRALSDGTFYNIVISALFYANFIMYMICILIAFNLIVVGGFLYSDQVPMGMELQPDQATPFVLLGVYLLIASGFGIYYHSYSKKRIKRRAT